MPNVPYQPYSTVSPSRQAIPYRSESVPSGAFGENVAQAQVGLGTAQAGFGAVLEKAGDEIMKRGLAMQELANETESKEAETKYVIEAGKMRADYSALSGKAAVDAYPLYQQNLKEARERIRGELSNDGARRKYDGPSMNTMSYTIYNGAGHAAQENRKWAVGAEVSGIDLDRMEALNNPRDDILFQKSLVKTVQSVNKLGELQGWPSEKTKATALQSVSDLWLKRIEGTARDEPFKAQDMLEQAQKRGDIQGEDIAKAQQIIKGQRNLIGSRAIADQVEQADSKAESSLQQRLDHGASLAEKVAPNDGIFKEIVQQRIHADWNQKKQIESDEKYNNIQVIEGALMGSQKEGKIPASINELVEDPKVRKAWDSLDEKTQRKYMGEMVRLSKGDVAWNQQRMNRYRELLGLSTEDPNKFLDISITAEDIPNTAKLGFIKLQQGILKKSSNPVAISKAIDLLGRDLNDAGIHRSVSDSTYLQFKGALTDQMQDFVTENKRPAKPAEIMEMGRMLLQKQATGYWSGELDKTGWGKTRTFELSLPNSKIEDIKAKLSEKHPDINFTDKQIQQEFVRQQFKQFFAGKPSTAKATGGPQLDTK